MASLLVKLDRARWEALALEWPDPDDHRRPLRRGELPEPQLAMVDDDGLVFIVVGDPVRVRLVGVVGRPLVHAGELVGGELVEYDEDLEPLLPRLGCAGAAAFGAWASAPRILAVEDVDLLRYTFGLPIEIGHVDRQLVIAPHQLAADDTLLVELRAAVWEAPDSLEARQVYADHLMALDDPRGELIALQLARRDDEPPTPRERTLVRRWGEACAQPLAPLLERYELRRGFVAVCATADGAITGRDQIEHPAWATVEELQSSNIALLLGAPLRARRLRIQGNELALLARHFEALPFETVLGRQQPDGSHHGVRIASDQGWRDIAESEAFERLRAISCDARSGPMATVETVLAGAFGDRLRHVELVLGQPWDLATANALRERFLASSLRTLAMRTELGGIDTLIAFVREPIPTLIVELDRATTPLQQRQLVRWLALLGRRIERTELRDRDAPDIAGERYDEMARQLRPMFAQVEIAGDAGPSLRL